MLKFVRYLATLGPIGHVPMCPGTAASLFTVLCMWALPVLPWTIHLGLMAVVIPFAVWSSGLVARKLGQRDPSCAVIDEFVGMNIALIGVSHSWQAYLAAFVLFRLFDIAKPFPINVIERRLSGGMGIVMDDVAAGLAARLVLFALSLLWPLW
ncbi:MAG: phosphatidylglycerophosphatase A [Candidatus Babeliales bacterium]|jgi:phosphatidylglycerophosphatase A